MNLRDVGVIVGSMTAVAVLSHIRARASGSLAEIAPLEDLEPEATFAGARVAKESFVRPKALGGGASELVAADGSTVRVGRGLILRGGTLSAEDRAPVRLGQDVFLL